MSGASAVVQWTSGWRHVFKADPDKELADETLEALCTSETDAIIVGGSCGITYDNTVDLLSRIRRYETACVLEVSSMDAVVPGFDGYLIPVVLNTPDSDYIVGHHQQALRKYANVIPWDRIAAEAYIILNPDCTAARVSSARTELDAVDVTAYARVADRLLGLPLIYLEYSGAFGSMELVKQVKSALSGAQLFYGGGIDGYAKASEAASAADTIVVGNVIYTDPQAALETVRAVREIDRKV